MVACPGGAGGHQGPFAENGPVCGEPGALSALWCRMGRVSAELPEYAERVLDVAELIPPGRVMTYGDIAEWLGEGARARWGG